LENLHPHLATRALKDFWLNDFSRTYIKIIRARLASGDKEAKYIMKKAYVNLLKLCAPMIPFLAEQSWQNLKEKKIVDEESVHLTEWPKVDKKKLI